LAVSFAMSSPIFFGDRPSGPICARFGTHPSAASQPSSLLSTLPSPIFFGDRPSGPICPREKFHTPTAVSALGPPPLGVHC
jgi:hypothetical protein